MIEEVQVQASLQEAAGIDYIVVLIVGLVVRSVNPVDDIQSAIDTEEEYIVAGEIFDVALALQEDQLGDDGEGLQVQREVPQELIVQE